MAKVLIIDSDNKTRALYRSELQKEGHEVFSVSDSKQAADLPQKKRFDLVIFEFNETHPLDLTFLEKRLEIDPDSKILINSDHPELKMNFHTWIADAFLAKSSGLSKLKKTIHALLNRQGFEHRKN